MRMGAKTWIMGMGFGAVLWLGSGQPTGAQICYPMITGVYPVGCQRGKSTEITVNGQQNFAGAYTVFFEGKGVQAEIVPPNPAPDAAKAQNTLTLKVTAEADTELGPREFRVMTPRGSSSIGMLVIGDDPEVVETEDNNTPPKANALTLPVTVNGRVQAVEDVDAYRFEARAGEEVVFSCISGRLQDKIHDLRPGGGGAHADLVLTLTDAEGRELALANDYWGPDPLLVYRFEKAGAYQIQVRDVRYQGDAGWSYRLTCTPRPYVTSVYPLSGKRGEAVSVQPVGFNLGGMTSCMVQVPEMAPGPMRVRLPAGGGQTNPVPFLVSDLPQIHEVGDNNTPANATPGTLPGGWNGRMEAAGDVDCFRFAAEKGKVYSFEVHARRYDSRMDPTIDIVDADGRTVVTNDDGPGIGKDSQLDWTCPADGEFTLRITDLHSRGGPDFVYSIAATPGRPDFLLQCDDDKALIGPGSGYAMYVIATRRNGFDGDIRLTVENLPPGVTATADRIPAGMTQACVVLRAAEDAKPDFRAIRIRGAGAVTLPDGTSETVERTATPMQEIYMPGGGRTPFAVNTHVASVTGPSDVLLKLSANRVTLDPGGTVTINVDVVRQNGYAKNVVLDVYLRHLGRKYGDPLPPGVSLDENASKTLLGPQENKGTIVLKAAADAKPIENLPIAVLGQVSINFVVKVSHASEPVFLTVRR